MKTPKIPHTHSPSTRLSPWFSKILETTTIFDKVKILEWRLSPRFSDTLGRESWAAGSAGICFFGAATVTDREGVLGSLASLYYGFDNQWKWWTIWWNLEAQKWLTCTRKRESDGFCLGSLPVSQQTGERNFVSWRAGGGGAKEKTEWEGRREAWVRLELGY